MTALERAKAFVQSRAAKTALQIMPLALAGVLSAHASSVQFTPSGNPQWQTPAPGTGSYLVLQSPTSSVSSLSDGGVTGNGSAGMQVTGGSGYNYTTFLMSGGGSGDFSNPFVTVSWDFTVTCDAACKANEAGPPPGSDDYQDTFSYSVETFINGVEYDWAGNGTTFYADPMDSYMIAVSGPLYSWSTQVDVTWLGNNGETANWSQSYLTIDPGTPTSGVPEPASMLLAASGLPFLLRLRKKR